MKHYAQQLTAGAARPIRAVLALAAICIMAVGCTANMSEIDEHGLRPYIAVDVRIPDKLAPHNNGQFAIEARVKGQPLEAEQVTFEFWPEGQHAHRVSVTGAAAGDGIYTADYPIPGEGIYVVRSVVSGRGLEAMPAKRFAVGEQAVLHLAALEEQLAAGAEDGSASGGGGHHSH